MNERYFACPKCEIYIDAGYRWAYWALEEPSHVKISYLVNVAIVLNLSEYWEPPEGERSTWLCEKVLPKAQRFLHTHETHGVIYVDSDVINSDDTLFYNWVLIGS